MPAEPAAHLWSASVLPRRRSHSSPGWCLKTVLTAAINSLRVDLLIDLLLLFNRKQLFSYEFKKNAPKMYIFCYLCSLRTHCSSLPQYRFQCVYILYRHKLFVEVSFGVHRPSHEQKHLMLLVLPIVIYLWPKLQCCSSGFHFKNFKKKKVTASTVRFFLVGSFKRSVPAVWGCVHRKSSTVTKQGDAPFCVAV